MFEWLSDGHPNLICQSVEVMEYIAHKFTKFKNIRTGFVYDYFPAGRKTKGQATGQMKLCMLHSFNNLQ